MKVIYPLFPVSPVAATLKKGKPVKKQDGLVYADYLVGAGVVPKVGAIVKIYYEGAAQS